MTKITLVEMAALIGALATAVGATVSIIVVTLRNGVPPMPTSPRVREKIVALVKELATGGVIAELGSGWGSLSLAMSRALPRANIVGYENSPVPFLFSVAARKALRVRNLRFVLGDFHRISLRDADVVVCYLSPDAMTRLAPKLETELGPTTVVVSSTFALPDWDPARTIRSDDVYGTPIYAYVAGCRRPEGDRGTQIDILH